MKKFRNNKYTSRGYILGKIEKSKEMVQEFERKIGELKEGMKHYKTYKNRYPKSLIYWMKEQAEWEDKLVST